MPIARVFAAGVSIYCFLVVLWFGIITVNTWKRSSAKDNRDAVSVLVAVLLAALVFGFIAIGGNFL